MALGAYRRACADSTSRASGPQAGSATSWRNWRAARPSKELPAPGQFAGTLRPYQVRGYSWLAFLRRWGLGACLADDMGLGKTIQTLALIQRDWQANGKRPGAAGLPDLGGRQLAEGGGALHARPAGDGPSRRRRGRRARPSGRRPRSTPWSSPATPCCTATWSTCKEVAWAGVDPRRGPEHQEPGDQAGAGRPASLHGRLPRRPHRHAGGEQRRRPVVHHGVPEPRLSGHAGRVQADASSSPSRPSRDPEAAERLKRLTGPFILRRLKTDKTIIADLPEKMEMKVFCTLTKEQASLYEAVVKEAEQDAGGGRGHPAQGG